MKNILKLAMDYLHLIVFIIFVFYLILTPCFLFGLLGFLELKCIFLRKLRNRLLGLNYAVFSEKIGAGLWGLKHVVFLVLNGSMFQ